MPKNKPPPAKKLERGERVARAALRILQETDVEVTEQLLLNGWKPTCSRGCTHCCHVLAVIGGAEAELLAQYLIATDTWAAALPALRTQALACKTGREMTEDVYWHARIACAFLGAEGECTAHGVRPSCCRYHIVFSDPWFCSYEANDHGTRVEKLDAPQAQVPVSMLSFEAGFSPTYFAPIPLAVLDRLHARLGAAVDVTGLPKPEVWGREFITHHKPEMVETLKALDRR